MGKIKVAIVVKSLSGGGAERAAAMLSLMLSPVKYEVTYVLFQNKMTFGYRGNSYVLNKNGSDNGFLNRFLFFIDFKKYLKREQFDYIIDFRGRTNTLRELLIYRFVYKHCKNIIFTIHEGALVSHVPAPFFLFEESFRKALSIIAVSKGMEHELKEKYLLENTRTINNALSLKEIQGLKDEEISESDEFVLIVGRLDDDIKQIDKLISLYPNTQLRDKNIKLFIMGEGLLQKSLQALVEEKNIENYVKFIPFQKNPYKYMSKAIFLILCSKHEGFPYVILESLACGTPVISFDCKTGPNEIIVNNHNGLLVDNQDFNNLLLAIDKMINEPVLYQFCKKNAYHSVKHYDISEISKQWEDVLV